MDVQSSQRHRSVFLNHFRHDHQMVVLGDDPTDRNAVLVVVNLNFNAQSFPPLCTQVAYLFQVPYGVFRLEQCLPAEAAKAKSSGQLLAIVSPELI